MSLAEVTNYSSADYFFPIQTLTWGKRTVGDWLPASSTVCNAQAVRGAAQ